jgi:hypothetical protein
MNMLRNTPLMRAAAGRDAANRPAAAKSAAWAVDDTRGDGTAADEPSDNAAANAPPDSDRP